MFGLHQQFQKLNSNLEDEIRRLCRRTELLFETLAEDPVEKEMAKIQMRSKACTATPMTSLGPKKCAVSRGKTASEYLKQKQGLSNIALKDPKNYFVARKEAGVAMIKDGTQVYTSRLSKSKFTLKFNNISFRFKMEIKTFFLLFLDSFFRHDY